MRSISDSELHSGVNDIDHNHNSNDQRNRSNQSLWRRLQERKRKQPDTKWGLKLGFNNLFSNRQHQALQPGGRNPLCWHRTTNRNRYNKIDYNQLNYKQLIGLLAVTFCWCLPGRAEGGGTTAIANPVATSSGSVSNQAVQINQGSYSQQGYGNGHTCNSSTLVLTPFFYLGNDVNNPEAAYIRNQNFGAQVSLSVPLDFEMVRLCKELAKRKLEKERLDYELVRILKCVEIKKAGYTIHPSSPYAGVCADVVPIAAARK
jgi:hypothetical protein